MRNEAIGSLSCRIPGFPGRRTSIAPGKASDSRRRRDFGRNHGRGAGAHPQRRRPGPGTELRPPAGADRNRRIPALGPGISPVYRRPGGYGGDRPQHRYPRRLPGQNGGTAAVLLSPWAHGGPFRPSRPAAGHSLRPTHCGRSGPERAFRPRARPHPGKNAPAGRDGSGAGLLSGGGPKGRKGMAVFRAPGPAPRGQPGGHGADRAGHAGTGGGGDSRIL